MHWLYRRVLNVRHPPFAVPSGRSSRGPIMRSEHRSPHFVSPALILIVLLLGAPALTPSCSSLASDTEDRSIPKQSQLSETYGKLPLYFEANRGQTDPEVKFLVRGPQQTLFLTSTEAVMVVTKRDPPAGEPATHGKPKRRGPATGTVLRMTFAGANPTARVTGLEELTGRANYFIGNDPSKWQTNVPTYARVRYQELYPGIDLVYYGNQRQLEYDFIVHPGADPSAIALGFAGADKLEVDARGDLLVHMAAGEIRQRKPVIYQE